jgi:hypothetical protein
VARTIAKEDFTMAFGDGESNTKSVNESAVAMSKNNLK